MQYISLPIRVPYLYEDAFQWYESFDPLGDLLPNPNPTPALEVMGRVVEYLKATCLWPADRMHLFGFGQGGTLAAEFALARWKRALPAQSAAGPSDNTSSGAAARLLLPLASLVSIEGPLLSFPTLKPPCAIPTLYFHRSFQTTSASIRSFEKGFSDVKEARCEGQEGMPRNKSEWGQVIQFWGRVLASRLPDMDGLHPVISGGPSVPV